MNYQESYDEFIKYVNYCKKIIKDTVYSRYDTKDIIISNNQDINEAVTNHRLDMIERKIDHTMRMIEQIIIVNNKMDFKDDLKTITKLAILFHDIGRFRQATWTNNYSDKEYTDNLKPFHNHGEDGYNIFINNDFKVDKKYIPVVGISILHHLDHHNVPLLNYKYNTKLNEIDINSIIKGSFNFTEKEWQIASLITQLVADIDKIDILYQHLSTLEIVREYTIDNSFKNLDEIASTWGISKNEIILYNELTEKEYTPRSIKIPTKNVDPKKFTVSDYYKNCFYNNDWPPLKEVRLRSDWNFASALWWRLGVFLNQIEFYTNLETIDDTDLLPRIYNHIEDEYKFLFTELFDYSEDIFVRKKLKDNEGKIYL